MNTLIVAQSVNKFVSYYETRRVITYSKQRATDPYHAPRNLSPVKPLKPLFFKFGLIMTVSFYAVVFRVVISL
jgi:hypothetical protein